MIALVSSQRCFHFACFGIVRDMADEDFRRTTGMFAPAARLSRVAASLAPITGTCRSSFCSPAQLEMKSGHFEMLQPVKGNLRLSKHMLQACGVNLMLSKCFRFKSGLLLRSLHFRSGRAL